jgi:hypothetical protein
MKFDRALLKFIERQCLVLPAPLNKPVKTPCWVAKRRIAPDGIERNKYLVVAWKGLHLSLHHLAAIFLFGEDEDVCEKQAAHQCDRKNCCRPSHMRKRSSAQNRQEAVDRGLIVVGVEKNMPSGSDHRRARATPEQVAHLKWLSLYRSKWFTPEFRSSHPNIQKALAVWSDLETSTVISAIRPSNWKQIVPVRPPELPSLSSVPVGAKPPNGGAKRQLSEAAIVDILTGYQDFWPKEHYASTKAKQYGVTTVMIALVMKREVYRDVRSDLPAILVSDFPQRLSFEQVQMIRATFVKVWQLYTKNSFVLTFAVFFDVRKATIEKTLARIIWANVHDVADAAIDPTTIPGHSLIRRGAKGGRPKSSYLINVDGGMA